MANTAGVIQPEMYNAPRPQAMATIKKAQEKDPAKSSDNQAKPREMTPAAIAPIKKWTR